MKFYIYVFVAVLAVVAPVRALLGAKLALLGALRNGLGGGNSVEGYGNGGGFGGGYGSSYRSVYRGGYGNGGYGHSLNYNRPVYTGQNSNYGWGQQSYGGGYAGGYSSGYNGGNEETVKVIKVIVNREQPQTYYNNYATSAADISTTSGGASWTPISLPTPVVRTYATQPVQTVQVSAPASLSFSEQPVQVAVPTPAQVSTQVQGLPAPVQVIQPPVRPIYNQPQPQPQYIQTSQPVYQRPIQYPVQQSIFRQAPQPQIIYQQTQQVPVSAAQPLPQVKTIRVLIDGESQHIPAQTYGTPPPAPTLVTPSVDNAGVWNSNSWSSATSGNGWNNVGSGPWKSGSIWESVGC